MKGTGFDAANKGVTKKRRLAVRRVKRRMKGPGRKGCRRILGCSGICVNYARCHRFRSTSIFITEVLIKASSAGSGQLDHLRAVGSIVEDGDVAGSEAKFRGPENHLDGASLAEWQDLAAIVGLGEIPAGDEAGKMQGRAARVGERN